jgi:hypothetical protein
MAIDSGENLLEDNMAKPSRWTAEKRYQIVKEALSQKESMGSADTNTNSPVTVRLG